jgi:hypothetical protein
VRAAPPQQLSHPHPHNQLRHDHPSSLTSKTSCVMSPKTLSDTVTSRVASNVIAGIAWSSWPERGWGWGWWGVGFAVWVRVVCVQLEEESATTQLRAARAALEHAQTHTCIDDVGRAQQGGAVDLHQREAGADEGRRGALEERDVPYAEGGLLGVCG